ncbi:putative palmitoyltransferase ZDHHC24 [Babylonia areolata]|uniref:putative palmitoyltransferase ZDHHC24 n=1 Tax=Babylonia areolata TaxID=304850 RepID=UPI003FCF2EE1
MQTVTMQRRTPIALGSADTSLKEKLKEHYQNRSFTPPPGSESRNGMITVGCGIFIMFLESLAVLLPGVYFGRNAEKGDSLMGRVGWFGEPWWVAVVVIVFSWVEVTWNWWRVYYDKPNWVTKDMKTALFGQSLDTPEGWRHCPTCQLDAPPRSHHCHHCGHCILKRDHHCFFTSSCVGFYNQRHFVMFCLYTIWGCLLAVYLQLAYISLSLPLPENYMMYVAPVPIFQLFTGNLHFGLFVLLVHVYINLIFMGTAASFLLWQYILILRGQTSYEAWRGIRTYNVGLFGNVTSVFGSPLTSWILYFAPLMLPLKGDGIRWNVQHKSGKRY